MLRYFTDNFGAKRTPTNRYATKIARPNATNGIVLFRIVFLLIIGLESKNIPSAK